MRASSSTRTVAHTCRQIRLLDPVDTGSQPEGAQSDERAPGRRAASSATSVPVRARGERRCGLAHSGVVGDVRDDQHEPGHEGDRDRWEQTAAAWPSRRTPTTHTRGRARPVGPRTARRAGDPLCRCAGPELVVRDRCRRPPIRRRPRRRRPPWRRGTACCAYRCARVGPTLTSPHPQQVAVDPVAAEVDLGLDRATVAETQQSRDRRDGVQVDVLADLGAEQPGVPGDVRRPGEAEPRRAGRPAAPRPTTGGGRDLHGGSCPGRLRAAAGGLPRLRAASGQEGVSTTSTARASHHQETVGSPSSPSSCKAPVDEQQPGEPPRGGGHPQGSGATTWPAWVLNGAAGPTGRGRRPRRGPAPSRYSASFPIVGWS